MLIWDDLILEWRCRDHFNNGRKLAVRRAFASSVRRVSDDVTASLAGSFWQIVRFWLDHVDWRRFQWNETVKGERPDGPKHLFRISRTTALGSWTIRCD